MISWVAVEDALHAWVVAGSGLPASKVVWSQQSVARASVPFVSLRIANLSRQGHDWLEVVDAPSPEAGAEIVHRSRGPRQLTLSLQAFAGAATGSLAAIAILEGIIAAANLPSRRDALNDAGVGVASFTPVLSLDGIVSTVLFEPRATIDVLCHVTSEVAEFGTYISTVEAETFTVDL